MRDPIEPLDGAETLVSTDLGSAENELVTLRVEEAVYDGQGVMVLARLAPKDPEQYALHNSFFLDMPEEEYLVEYGPAEVPEGVYPYANGTMEIRNGPDERALYVDGEPVELPTDRETADAAGLPVYLDGDAMYFTHQESEQVTRLDGKQMILFEAVMVPASEGAEGLSNGMSGNAEAQPDGSVLLWFDAFSDAPLPETVEMKLNVSVFLDGKPFPLEDNRLLPRQGGTRAHGRLCAGRRWRDRRTRPHPRRKYDRDEGAGLSDHRLRIPGGGRGTHGHFLPAL